MTLVTSAIDDRGVATLTLNRPEKHNALDGATVRELHAAQIDLVLRGGPQAVRAAKKLVRRVADRSDRDVLAEETAQLLARLRVTAEGKEGLSAFLERRKPAWHPTD